MGKNQSINSMMEDCRIKIWNASGDEIISTRLEPFGYAAEKWEAAKNLYNSAQSGIAENEKEHSEWRTAGDTFNNAQAKARKDFTKIRQYLKFFYPANSPGANQLDLYDDNFSRYADFIQGAGTFYSNLLSFNEAIKKLGPFGYTNESIQQLADEVSQLNTLKENREKESGDAQYAIKERNAKIDELNEFCNELTRLTKLVFQDDEAQYLEKLGILVRS